MFFYTELYEIMINLKDKFAVAITKTMIKIIKSLNIGSGTNFPGRIARKISPEILSKLVNQTKKEIVVVTGTNGKTTTSGFISSILSSGGRNIAHNRKGANMLPGITTAMIQEASLNCRLNIDNCLLEVDEAYSVKAVDEFNPEIMLITNLFRDQLDRYGELDATAKKICTAIDKTTKKKHLKLILNADDPIVANITNNKNVSKIFYGFNSVNFTNLDKNIKAPQEIATCQCGKKYNYSKLFYGHIGHYYCDCDVLRPRPKIDASVEIDATSSILTINEPKNLSSSIRINMPGLYNAYNALAAITLGLETGLNIDTIKNALENYETVFGRAELTYLRKKPCLIQLIKNPIGASEVLRTVKNDDASRLLIIINDDYADGKDVSWLWDANFELLSNHHKEIVTSGIRAADMATRLKYAGINKDKIKIIDNIKKAVGYSLNNLQQNEKLYILPTYTALLKLQNILKKLI